QVDDLVALRREEAVEIAELGGVEVVLDENADLALPSARAWCSHSPVLRRCAGGSCPSRGGRVCGRVGRPRNAAGRPPTTAGRFQLSRSLSSGRRKQAIVRGAWFTGFLISLTRGGRKQKIRCSPLLLERSRACRRRSSARRVTGGSTRAVVRPARARSSS